MGQNLAAKPLNRLKVDRRRTACDHSKVVTMEERSMKASEFKAKCLAVLDEVHDTGRAVTITKHGKPVAKVTPVAEPDSLRGSVTFLVSDEELIAPLGEPWNADLE